MSYPYTGPFLVLRRDGGSRVFDTAAEAWAYHMLRPREIVGKNFSTSWDRPFYGYVEPLPVDVVIYDHFGTPVDPAWLRAEFIKVNSQKSTAHDFYKRSVDVAQERGLPVPGTGHSRRRRYGGWLRHPRHIGMYRANEALRDDMDMDEEWSAVVRRHISTKDAHHPPNAWDDLVRADLYDRNWKNFRRTRWK
jgi:hypothetical protein